MYAHVAIVGGGLSGCATALHLAATGREVVVLERTTLDEGKICGEGLMPHGVDLLRELGVLPSVMRTNPVPFTGVSYFIGTAHAVGRFPSGFGLGVRRRRVDAVLRGLAAEHPRIDLRRGVKVRKVEVSRRGARLETSAGVLMSEVVVGADGLHSVVRRSLGLSCVSRGRHRYGARLHLLLADGVPNLSQVEVHVLSRAEVYLTPTGPRELNLTFLLEREEARRLRGDIRAGLAALVADLPAVASRLHGATEVSPPAICGPLRQESSAWFTDRAVLVGDAAFFLDGITGEGMSLSLLSAVLAARTIDQALDKGRCDRGALAPYTREYARSVREKVVLTEGVLWGLRRPASRLGLCDSWPLVPRCSERSSTSMVGAPDGRH